MSFLNILIYVLVPLAVAVYFFLKKKFSYFEENDIPHIKPIWPYGNMKGAGKSIHMVDLIQKIYDECKEKDVIAGFYTLFSPSLIVMDLELIKEVTIKQFSNFTDRGVFVNEQDEPLTGHLFAIGGDKWRFLRNKLSPVFTSGKIKSMYHTISDKGNGFVEAIDSASKSGSVELKDISNRFTIDVVGSVAFGMEANTLKHEHPELVSIFRQIFGEEGISIALFFFLFAFPKFSKFIQLRQFNKTVTDFFYNVVGGTISHRESNNITRNDFLNMLIQLKNKGSIDGEISTESRKLTLDEVIAQAFLFFFAGADTSSTAISYAITKLSIHQDVQEKLRKEIIEKTESSNGEITYDNLNEMTYLNQVMNETLRMYPPAFVTVRQALNDFKIPGSKHVIKAGTQLMIPNICIHYDERYWTNPKEFNPDRFTPEESAKRPNQAFMPFGEGPRNCIGMRFAQVNVKFAIATAIKNFKVTLDTMKTQLPMKFVPRNPNIVPIGGLWVKFEKL